jgi:hypothetical protein
MGNRDAEAKFSNGHTWHEDPVPLLAGEIAHAFVSTVVLASAGV